MKSCEDIPFVVKVCGITTVADARVAVEAGANALGFNFYRKSPRFVTIEQAKAISEAVHGDYLRVGVFVNPSVEDISGAALTVPLDVIQVHGAVPGNLPPEIRLWRAMAPAGEPAADDGRPEAYLLDTPSDRFGGTGVAFPWELAAGFQGRAILAGGLHGGNVEQAIATVHPWGVDACSRLEASPGRKDPQLVREFIRAALKAAQAQVTLEIAV